MPGVTAGVDHHIFLGYTNTTTLTIATSNVFTKYSPSNKKSGSAICNINRSARVGKIGMGLLNCHRSPVSNVIKGCTKGAFVAIYVKLRGRSRRAIGVKGAARARLTRILGTVCGGRCRALNGDSFGVASSDNGVNRTRVNCLASRANLGDCNIQSGLGPGRANYVGVCTIIPDG